MFVYFSGPYFRLLDVIRASLVSLQKAIKGLVVMSASLEQVAASVLVGKVSELTNLSKLISSQSKNPQNQYIEKFIPLT